MAPIQTLGQPNSCETQDKSLHSKKKLFQENLHQEEGQIHQEEVQSRKAEDKKVKDLPIWIER